MKTVYICALLTFTLCLQLNAADKPAKVIKRYKARVTCFNGKIDSGSSCSGTNYQEDGTAHDHSTMTCGYPGKVSKIEWGFLERRGTNDIYKFIRTFPLNAAITTTTTTNVTFNGSRVIVFQDSSQVVVIEPPKK